MIIRSIVILFLSVCAYAQENNRIAVAISPVGAIVVPLYGGYFLKASVEVPIEGSNSGMKGSFSYSRLERYSFSSSVNVAVMDVELKYLMHPVSYLRSIYFGPAVDLVRIREIPILYDNSEIGVAERRGEISYLLNGLFYVGYKLDFKAVFVQADIGGGIYGEIYEDRSLSHGSSDPTPSVLPMININFEVGIYL